MGLKRKKASFESELHKKTTDSFDNQGNTPTEIGEIPSNQNLNKSSNYESPWSSIDDHPYQAGGSRESEVRGNSSRIPIFSNTFPDYPPNSEARGSRLKQKGQEHLEQQTRIVKFGIELPNMNDITSPRGNGITEPFLYAFDLLSLCFTSNSRRAWDRLMLSFFSLLLLSIPFNWLIDGVFNFSNYYKTIKYVEYIIPVISGLNKLEKEKSELICTNLSNAVASVLEQKLSQTEIPALKEHKFTTVAKEKSFLVCSKTMKGDIEDIRKYYSIAEWKELFFLEKPFYLHEFLTLNPQEKKTMTKYRIFDEPINLGSLTYEDFGYRAKLIQTKAMIKTVNQAITNYSPPRILPALICWCIVLYMFLWILKKSRLLLFLGRSKWTVVLKWALLICIGANWTRLTQIPSEYFFIYLMGMYVVLICLRKIVSYCRQKPFKYLH